MQRVYCNQHMIEPLKKAAHEAGKILLSYFKKKLVITHKTTHHNIVTEADIAAQKVVIDSLTSSLVKKGIAQSDIGFIGEENVFKKGKHLFVIDPLDGTNNFASRIPYFGVSIGYFHDGVLFASVIYHPTENVYYCAAKGKGAFGEKGKMSTPLHLIQKPLHELLLTTHISSDENTREELFDVIKHLFEKIRGVRIYGSIVLDCGRLAENQSGVILSGRAYIWDIAAGKLLIEESGGKMTDWKGKELVFNLDDPHHGYQLIASHPKIIEAIIT